MSKLLEWFTDPPRSFSPVPIWWWSGEKLDAKRLRWELERFAEGGIYNVIVLNLAPTSPLYGSDADDPPFFSEAWWHIFRQVCLDARELGIYLWFYDQIGFSGANLQGDIIQQHPEYGARTLERVAQNTSGPLTLACPEGGSPLAAAALPLDEAGQPAGPPVPLALTDKSAIWSGSGKHRIMLFYQIERGFDYFNRDACTALLQTVHGAFDARVSDFFGNTIVGSFQDELPSMPAWSSDFATRFQQLRGYDLLPRLAALWEDYGEETDQIRRDYHATRAELAEQAFFKPFYEWHAQRNLICGFDQQGPVRAGDPKQSVNFYADYLRTHRWYDAPGSDHHGDAKIHSSLAHLYDRKRVWIESFHSSGWGGTLEETYDWLLAWIRAGANLYNPHAVYYSTRGGWWEWAPPSTDWRQPYWKHNAYFARTVSRLCSILTLGHHVCDTGILFPTATIQADLKMDGSGTRAQAAHEAYLQLIGKMVWFDLEPGIMDKLCRDYDILDDDSLQRGSIEAGRLLIGNESYAILILPACQILEEQTAAKLVAFVHGGGTLISFGDLPGRGIGGDTHVQQLLALFQNGSALHLHSEEELGKALAQIPAPIEASVPTLIRKVDASTVVFVPAIFPRATQSLHEIGQQPQSWIEQGAYTFDPSRYQQSIQLRVRNVTGAPLLYEPCSREIRPVTWRQTDDGVEVTVPFEDGPGALLVWNGDGQVSKPASSTEQIKILQTFDDTWDVQLVPTLDNRWGDFALPVQGTTIPLERWELQHAIEPAHTPGEQLGWQHADFDDSAWTPAQITFGPHGIWTGPAPAQDLPAPGSPGTTHLWQTASYSLSRGIYKDTIHHSTLGPKGHVPEEFLDFGVIKAGQAVQFRTIVTVPVQQQVHLALGAAAAKEIWLNGQAYQDTHGYLFSTPVTLQAGENHLEFRLLAESDNTLRAHYAFITDPDAYKRPEWIQAGGQWQQDSLIVFKTQLTLAASPTTGIIQIASNAPCLVRVNGEDVGRHGGFDPYFNRNATRIQPYDITNRLHTGVNRLEIELVELHAEAAIFVDGLVHVQDQQLSITSDQHWEVFRNQKIAPVLLRRQQFGDPSFPLLWRRPHPLPETAWLETQASEVDIVLPFVSSVPASVGTVEWLRFLLPPGATRMHLELYGTASIYINGKETPARNVPDHILQVELPDATGESQKCAIRVKTTSGFQRGAIFRAPIRFETGTGKLRTGNWQENGLPGYSGSVSYSQKFVIDEVKGQVFLDLGTVRGNAEVFVNGQSVGVRIWSPYRFDITNALRPGENELTITVYNTLGPYIDAISPSHFIFPIQTISGLMGPVTLLK